MPKEESSSARNKARSEYEERTDEVTGNKEIEQVNTKIAVYEVIEFWPEQLLVDLVTSGPKSFKTKMNPCSDWGENGPRVMLQHRFYKIIKNGETVLRS